MPDGRWVAYYFSDVAVIVVACICALLAFRSLVGCLDREEQREHERWMVKHGGCADGGTP